jgi:transposase
MARPRTLTETQVARLRAVARGGRTSELAEWCERELGVRYSTSSLGRLLPKLGMRLLPNSRWTATDQ